MSLYKYAWKVTGVLSKKEVLWSTEDEKLMLDTSINIENFSLLKNKFPDTVQRWMVADDDGIPYAEGLIVGEWQGFEPLDDWATSDLGCTRLYFWTENGDNCGPGWYLAVN